ncbi:MAG: hypothetical protein KAW84_06215 [Thermoplasmata archaeon]|nr:hypothetical protein [Thermoplasmata archaeon]
MARSKRIKLRVSEGLYEMISELAESKGWPIRETADLTLLFGILEQITVKRFQPSQKAWTLFQADSAEGFARLLRISTKIDPEDEKELQKLFNQVVEFLQPTWDVGVQP